MARAATERVTRGLRWVGLGLLVAGVAVVVGGIGFTRTVEALTAASAIAILAFGLPGAAAFGLALWLEHVAAELDAPRKAPAPLPAPETPRPRNPFRAPWRDYAIAVAAVLAAWGVRAALDPYIPAQVPFITFFLAVAIAGWVGGFGPSALATLLSLAVAGYFYVLPDLRLSSPDLSGFVVLGLFVLVCLGIGAIMATLHDALGRTRQLADEARRQAEAHAASGHRLRALAESAPVPLFLADEQLACTYCNRAWLAWRGRALAEELGHGWWDGVHAEDLAARRQALASAVSSGAVTTVEYRLRDAEGNFRRVRDVVQVSRDRRGAVLALVGACLAQATARDDQRAEPLREPGAEPGTPEAPDPTVPRAA